MCRPDLSLPVVSAFLQQWIRERGSAGLTVTWQRLLQKLMARHPPQCEVAFSSQRAHWPNPVLDAMASRVGSRGKAGEWGFRQSRCGRATGAFGKAGRVVERCEVR